MAKRLKKNKNKRGISKIKKKNVNLDKMGRQGVIKKQKSRKRVKERKKEQRTYHDHLNELKEEVELESSLKKKMIEIASKDPVQLVLRDYYNKPLNNKKWVKILNNKKRLVKFMEGATSDGKEKEMLPILTDEGWIDQTAPVTEEMKELQLKAYKRDKYGKVRSKKDLDSGISDGEENEEENKVKNTKGLVPDLSFKTLEDVDEEYFKEDGEESDNEPTEKSVAQIFAEKKRYIQEQKTKMACIAMNVVQDVGKVENLKFLQNMFVTINPKENPTVYKYALITMLQVFNDLIPGYRIQEGKSTSRKMKKEVYETYKEEKSFLGHYKSYLKTLEKILLEWKEDPENLALKTVSEVAAKCLGELLVNHPSFNFSANLIEALVPYLNSSHSGISKAVFEALSKTIQNDKSCYMTLRVVRNVYRLVRRKEYRVRREVVQVFLSLRSNEMKNQDKVKESERTADNARTHKEKLIRNLAQKAAVKPSKKQKKERKKIAILEKKMESITEEELLNAQNARHSEILEKVFAVYIRVLKMKAKNALVLDVLEGLSKFAHLINLEFFSDLLKLMNEFVEEEILNARGSFLCIKTVFTILSGQGEYLTIDPHRFYCLFYRHLLGLSREEKEENVELILEIIEQMLILRRKRVSGSKVLSFTKRLSTLSLTLPHQSAIPVLAGVKNLFTTFPTCDALLDPDPDGSPGTFNPSIADPEHANSTSTAVWEITLMALRHYHPTVRILANNILSGGCAREVSAVHEVTKRSTSQLLEDFNVSTLKFNPFIPPPPNSKTTKNSNKEKKQLLCHGTLDLTNLKLQSICEKVLMEDGDDTELKEPSRKRSRNSDENDTRDETEVNYSYFKDCIKVCSDESSCDNLHNYSRKSSKLQDFTSFFIDVK